MPEQVRRTLLALRKLVHFKGAPLPAYNRLPVVWTVILDSCRGGLIQPPAYA